MNDKTRFGALPLAVACLVAAFALGAGCNGCIVDPGTDAGEDAGDSGTGDAGSDGGTDAGTDAGADAGDGGNPVVPPTDAGCIPSGAQCSATHPCCSANCTDQNYCGVTVLCAVPGGACDENSDCCSGQCGIDGKCSEERCLDVTQACTGNSQCCSGICNGTCQPLPSACLALGSSCNESNDQCCSMNCRDGVCQKAYTCQATGDSCTDATDCCSGLCSGGVCALIGGSGGTSNCDPEGVPCTAANDCCTNVCKDLGSGQAICQPVGGCEVTGAVCQSSLQCCGGVPNGPVTCEIARNATYGKCDQGTACNDPGNICGKPQKVLPDGGITCVTNQDGSCYQVPYNSNCCGDKGAACRMDDVNVPRCFGGQGIVECPYGYTGVEPCCVAQGNYCEFSDECCGGGLCLPNDAGVRACVIPTCLGLGTLCTPGATGDGACCAGSACLQVDELNFACQLPPQPGEDAGTTCDENGSSCTSAATCCSGICNQNTCGAPPPCQPEGSTCTASGDCCSGLSCDIPSGSTTGTCRTGATCPAAGQVCSPSNLCCNEGTSLLCTSTSTGAPCNGTTTCTCDFIVGKKLPDELQP